jgi:hypothetical protein
MTSIKSKQRVADQGEVFAPAWMVEAMLDRVKDKTDRIDYRSLEPAWGSRYFSGADFSAQSWRRPGRATRVSMPMSDQASFAPRGRDTEPTPFKSGGLGLGF